MYGVRGSACLSELQFPGILDLFSSNALISSEENLRFWSYIKFKLLV